MRLPRSARIATTTLAAIGLMVLGSLPGAAFEPRATAIYIEDYNTGMVLMDINSDVPLPPASMSKLMTLNMLFEALEDGRVQLDQTFTVSTRAREMGGSTMFLDERHRPTAEDLIRGIAVLSGNDATVVVAEGLAGTEDAFARLATARARELGMSSTTIANASGWPHPEHRMSMRDLALLARRMISDFPQYYPYLAEERFTWAGVTQDNRVPLLGAGLGLDGLKTGHTSEAGYSLTGSALQGDRRIIFVFSGLNSAQERVEEAERIINWAFRQFVERRLFEAGQRVATADVWLGSAPSVGLVAAEDVRVLLPAVGQSGLRAEAVFHSPLEAPIQAGQELGELVITIPDLGERRVPLLAEDSVGEGGFVVRLRAAAQLLLGQVMGDAGAATAF